MRLITTDLLPKTRSLVEGISDGLTGYLTYRARCSRASALTGDDLYRPICEVASFEGWMISHVLPVMVGPSADDQACVDFLLRYEPEDSPEMSQCVLLQVLVTHASGGEPLAVDMELRALVELRVLLAEDVRYAAYEFTSLLMLAGPHGRRFGHTLRRELADPKIVLTHLDTFACHAGGTDFGVTIYKV